MNPVGLPGKAPRAILPGGEQIICAAADQGIAIAQENVGTAYEWGLGTQQDYASALHWYQLASEQGDSSAQTKLGILYFKGKGVVADQNQACSLWSKAAGAGETIATQNLQNHCNLQSAAN